MCSIIQYGLLWHGPTVWNYKVTVWACVALHNCLSSHTWHSMVLCGMSQQSKIITWLCLSLCTSHSQQVKSLRPYFFFSGHIFFLSCLESLTQDGTITLQSKPASFIQCYLQTDTYQGSYKKSFHNSQTFHKHLQHVYGAEKQHEGTQLFRTSSKGA